MSHEILVVKLGALGDVLAATGFTRALRLRGVTIHFLTDDRCRPLLENNPDIESIITVDAGSPQWYRCLLAVVRLGWIARRYRRTTIILLHRRAWIHRIFRWAGARQVVAWTTFDTARPRWERLEAVLRAIGLAGSCRRLCLLLTAAERADGEEHWRRGVAQTRIVLAPGGGANAWSAMPNRRWPLARWAVLAAALRSEGHEIRIVGDSGDRRLGRWIVSVAGASGVNGSAEDGPPIVNRAGDLGLRETAALIAAADLVISNDSLAWHLAAALEVPALALFGPTSARLVFSPPGRVPRSAGLQGEAGCGPCYDPRAGRTGQAYRCRRSRCMESIPVAAVLHSAAELLAGFRANSLLRRRLSCVS